MSRRSRMQSHRALPSLASLASLASRGRAGRISALVLALLGSGAVAGLTLGPAAGKVAIADAAKRVYFQIFVSSGNQQHGIPGRTLASPLVAKVFGDYVEYPGAWVYFTSLGSGGYSPGGPSEDEGLVTAEWQVPTTGPFRLRACVAFNDYACTTFSVIVTATITKVAGDNQLVVPGQAVGPMDPAVELRDSLGRAVVGDTVYFDPGSNGAVTVSANATDVTGRVATHWTTTTAAGPYTLRACYLGGCTTFTAPTTPPPKADYMAQVSNTSATCGQGGHPCLVSGNAGPGNPTIYLRDQNGAALSGKAINWTLSQGGGTLSAPTVMTGSQGDAGQAAVVWTFPGRRATTHSPPASILPSRARTPSLPSSLRRT
jgi:hypothetical protein